MGVSISRIRHIGLFTPALAEHARFYSDVWSLQVVAERDESVYFRGASSEFFLLSLHAAARRGIHHIGFGVSSRSAVDVAADQLAAAGVRILNGPGELSEPGGGYGVQFVDPDGRCIELSANVSAHSGGWKGRRVEPNSICHVVLNTPDIDRICDFFTKILGLRVSDWSEHQMVFLRCSSKHHVVSFNQAAHASLNHVAYLVSGVDEIMRGLANLRSNGMEPVWGPGRHGPGNNIFCYFKDPVGYITEYTSDIDHIADEAAHQPKGWSRTPDAIDRWGLAGPPSPEVRSAMAGEPDTGWMSNSGEK
jgi:catechol 2,3-dioxygenase-like lactoylglutathione lyase family enzyme